MNIEEVFALRGKIWATRDACAQHIPRRCPAGCPNAGIHDETLNELCECRECA
jgi:hypothetical protein